MSNILNLKTGEPFDPLPRLHHRPETSLAVSSSVNSQRARGMLLAAKSFYIGGAKWINPYQTSDNALIAMWDGEWNAGGGVHDASRTTPPVNIVTGSNDLHLSSTSTDGVSYTSNSLFFNKKTIILTDVISLGKCYTAQCSYRTVEHTQNNRFSFSNRFSDFSGRRFFLGASATGSHLVYTATGGETLRGATGIALATVAQTDTVVYYEDNVYSQYGRGGRSIAYSANGDELNTSFIIGGWIGERISYAFYGEIYSIRLYAKSLSSDEVIYFSGIDHERGIST